MKDTAKRIRAYKAALPGLKERLAAVALLLVVSTVMMISATFAWITLSRAPEVTGINTTISGNGNLEIALSDKDGLAPDEFDVDESLTKGVNVTLSNLEWGNLINLSDPSYGIDNLALRPAQLNTANLLGSPLWGAVYAEDGRITALDSNYAYTMFDETKKEFLVSSDYGVRAISSYVNKTTESDDDKGLKDRINEVMAAKTNVVNAYASARGTFSGLSAMVSRYAQDVVNGKQNGAVSDGTGTDANYGPYLKDLISFYEALDHAMVAQQDAYVALANLQIYRYAVENKNLTYQQTSWEEVLAKNGTAGSPISISELGAFVQDKKTLEEDLAKLKAYKKAFDEEGKAYYWTHDGDTGYQIKNMVDRLIGFTHVPSSEEGVYVYIDNGKIYVSQISGNDMLTLYSYNKKTVPVYITRGILKNFEQRALSETDRIGAHDDSKMTITARAKKGITIEATVYGKGITYAEGLSAFDADFGKAQGSLVTKDAVAQDTYGMAVDLWVRTNAESTCLTLEGATAVDENGNIIRYDGANRIWGRVPSTDTIYTTESTSQGGGSCYIYYADTPEDMARSLDLLDSMKVAFVSQGGTLLATAEMDTVNYCAVNGRVTVPLVLDTNTKTTYTYTDSMNQEVVGKAITTLTYDAAERITAIIYLDGTHLTNDNVLAASKIQGQLNIQFGSSKDLQTIGSNDLIDDVRTVTAAVNNTNINFDAAVTEEDRKVTVTVKINGTTATEVQAFFVRAINSTQGSREKEMNFTEQADGTWTKDYVFTAPGDYYLRYVRLNGVDYALANPLHVTVSGFALKSVTWDQREDSVVVRTSDGTFSTKVTVEFASNDLNKLPNTVQARFVRTDGNTVNVPLSRGTNGQWTGTGNFTTSGVYKLEYLVYTTNDSKGSIYKDLGNDKKTLDLALGMYVEVKDMTGKLEENYKSDGVYDKTVEVRIYDNAGNAIEGLENAWLYYSNNGSASNTIHSDLTWNAGKYDAILPIKTAGRWMFGYVDLGSQYLTKASSSPTYTIISPDPVAYDDSSETTYNTPNGGGIQFVPLTNDATIDGIKLANADTANVSAVVYNASIPGEQKYITVPVNVTSRHLKLPTYTTGVDADGNPDQNTATQDGTWYVAAIILTNCYGEDKAYHGETNPIIWAGTDKISEAYVESQKDTAGFHVTAYKDFSKLATQVSSSLNVAFTAGTVELGANTGYEFMHQFLVQETNMGVKLTDNGNNVIPESKVSSIKLSVSYTAPKDGVYSYNVESGFGKNYDITFERTGENENYTVSGNTVWQYVGEYRVNSLEVVIGGVTKTYHPGEIGLPEKYTVRTAGYTEENISVEEPRQSTKVFGMNSNGLVVGKFLDSYDLSGTNVKVTLTPKDADGNQYVKLDNVEAKLLLTHTGDSQKNGGYTFENSSLAKLEVSMTSAAGSDVYKAGSANLLAGTYSAKVQVKVGSVTKTKVLENISVYSVKPDVTMALAAGTPTTVTVNKFDKVEDSVYYRETFTGNNSVVDGGHSAVLFASVTRSTEKGKCDGHWYVVGTSYDYSDVHTAEFATYTMPSLVFTLSNGGDVCKNFTLAIPNNGNNASATFTDGSGTSKPIPIGTINSGSTPRTDGESEKFNYPSQTAKTIGTQEIRTITATYGDETYTIQLSTPLSIVQKNEAVPSLTFKVDDEDFLTPADVVSQDGRAFEVTLPTALYTKDQKTFVVRNESAEPVIEEPIIDGGGDPSAQLPDKNAIPVADWTQGNTTVTRKVYTESHELVEDKLHLDYHGSKTPWGKEYKTLEPAYQNKYTQEKYLETDAEFAIEKDVSQKGTSTVVRTDLNYDVKYSLKAWLVDGKEVEPGKTVRITGNSVAIPVLKGEKTLKETTKTTTVTAGLTHYYFRITCTGTQTTKEGTVGPNETNKWYCSAKTCGSYEAKGSKENAKNAALAVYGPAPVGYTRVNAVTEGRTIDKNSISDWELTDTVPEGGNTTETIEKFDGANKRTQRVTSELTGERLMKKTTETFDSNEKLIRKEVTTYTYDANGNRTSETIVYDGNGNIISGG